MASIDMDSRNLLRVDRAPRELVGATALLAIVMIAQLAAAHAFQLFARPFWFDEWVTHLIASDPDPSRAARALSSAIDNNTPILFVLMRKVGWLGSTSPEVAYRCFSFVTVFAGLIGLYLALRQSFTALVAWTAVLSVWTHPLVLGHAFEARYYGPMFAGAIWFAYLLGRTAQSPSMSIKVVAASRRRVPVHDSLLRRGLHGPHRRRRAAASPRNQGHHRCLDRLRTRGHRARRVHAVTGGTTARASVEHLSTEAKRRAHLGVSRISSCRYTWRRLRSFPELRLSVPRSGFGIAMPPPKPLLGWTASPDWPAFFLYPVVLIVFSFVVQGVLLVRYALPALAGIGPAVGFVSSRLSRLWLAALCAFFLLSGTRTLRHMEEQELYSEQEMGKLLDALRRDTGDAPITFEIHMPHDLAYYALDLAPRIYYLGGETPFFKSPEIQTPYYSYSPAGTIWCRSWGRRGDARIYGQIQVMPWEKLRRLPRRFIVVGTDPIESFDPPIQEYPGFTLRHVERSLYELVENTP